jgi:predicted phage-related endonuclease
MARGTISMRGTAKAEARPPVSGRSATLPELPAERRDAPGRHVGSSEAAALFNLSPYVTRLELYLRKRGELPDRDLSGDEGDEAVRWGQYLKPAVRQWVADRMGWTVRKVHRYVTHPAVEGMGCSLDFEVLSHGRGAGILEVETVDRLAFRGWEGGRPPLHYELQLQHQLACTGRLWGALGVLIGGNELLVIPYERHPGAIQRIEREVPIFWREVAAGRPPKASYEADLRTLTTLYRHATRGSFLDLRGSARASELCAAYEAASEAERAARARRDAAKTELLELIGSAETTWIDGYRISACTVAGGEVAYVRQPYRSFRVARCGRRRPAARDARDLTRSLERDLERSIELNRERNGERGPKCCPEAASGRFAEEHLRPMPPPEPEPVALETGAPDHSPLSALDAFAAAGEEGPAGGAAAAGDPAGHSAAPAGDAGNGNGSRSGRRAAH